MNSIQIRSETLRDRKAVSELYNLGFPNSPEGNIVKKLRSGCPEYHAWVAFPLAEPEHIVGHILLTPAELKPTDGTKSIWGLGLAPLVVHPDWRSQRIGSNLVHHALNASQYMHQTFIVVLGNPNYYHRFGFVTASIWDLQCEYAGIPNEAFMVNLLDPDELAGKTGTIYYRPEFAAAT